MDLTDISSLLLEYGDSLKCVLPRLLGVLGEGIVYAEMRKRGIAAKLCAGQKRAIDLETESGLRVQVKTAQRPRFVTGITQKRFANDHAPDIWVLVLLTRNTPRFFVLTHQEICALQKACNDAYGARYAVKHGKAFDKQGVDNLPLTSVEIHEDSWDKLRVTSR